MSAQTIEAQITLYRQELPVHITIIGTYDPGCLSSGGYSNPGAHPDEREEVQVTQTLTEDGEAFELQPGEMAEAEEALKIAFLAE